MRLYRQLPHLS
ncbi:hypothetical protein Zm00014a_020974 [Zea mays]|uniref:Uncharacterized protein n=1 Tax=Zea mays TaxID=4577 RepID=A0A3L6ECA6_MAIZE|nr:hypothetical protein Zm00014a_020974 [Zea mays]